MAVRAVGRPFVWVAPSMAPAARQSLEAAIAVAGVLVVCGYAQAEVSWVVAEEYAKRSRTVFSDATADDDTVERDWLAVVLLQAEEARTIPAGILTRKVAHDESRIHSLSAMVTVTFFVTVSGQILRLFREFCDHAG